MSRIFRCCLLGVTVLSLLYADRSHSQDFNTALMNSTFEILGPTAVPGQQTFGTIFILGKPTAQDPKRSNFVLVTAAHVLNEINGDMATLLLRKRNDDGTYTAGPYQIRIREDGQNLYAVNPSADVAAMYVTLPTGLMDDTLISTNLLFDDEEFTKYELHPGDELLCLGFPLAINLEGFPVIRTGLLASYPITPSRKVGKFFYTFHVFPGNSGGPVYIDFRDRAYGKVTHLGEETHAVVGLVSGQQTSLLPEYRDAEVDIAAIIPSSLIKDTVAMLPPKPSN